MIPRPAALVVRVLQRREPHVCPPGGRGLRVLHDVLPTLRAEQDVPALAASHCLRLVHCAERTISSPEGDLP